MINAVRFHLASIVLLVVVPCALLAQSVTTGALSTNTICSGSTITVNYTASGTFGAKNVFTVQLSAPDGSFSPSFQNVGQVKSTTSGSISVTLNVSAGVHYRLRVAASNPYTVSNDNGSDITIGAFPSSRFFSSKYAILQGDSITFMSDTLNITPGASFRWNFGDGANPATSTASTVTVVYTLQGSKNVSLTVTSPLGCGTTSMDSGYRVLSCNPSIPSDAFIDSVKNGDIVDTISGDVWVVPGGTTSKNWGYVTTIYAEPGSTVEGGSNRVVYLKDGATYEGNGYDILIYSPGAGLNNIGYCTLLPCSSLAFDYSNAPPYKIMHAGVAQDQANAKINLYPNPATSLVTVESPEIPRSISVRNELGEEMLRDEGPHATKRFEFDVSRFASGVYYLEMGLGSTRETVKFTVGR